MGQMYLQHFEYRGAINKSEFDEAWGVANQAMADSGNWGNVQSGVKHLHAYGTGSGGYALIEVEDLHKPIGSFYDLHQIGVSPSKPEGAIKA